MIARVLVTAAIAWPSAVFGQGEPNASRGLASINAGTQVSTQTLFDTVTFIEFLENGTFQSRQELGSGPVIDAGVSVALWRGLGVGVAVSTFQATDSAAVSLDVPHPFFFGRGRTFSDTVDLTRRTVAVHVAATYAIPTDGRIRVVLSGGPSIFNLSQDMVADVQFQDVFPFDTFVDPRATIQTESEIALGYNAGVDVGVRIGSWWGVGFLLRYTRGTVDLMPSGTRTGFRTIGTDVGGLHVGGGLRLFF